MRIRIWTVAVIATLAAGALAGGAAIQVAKSAANTDPAGDVKKNDQPWQDLVAGRVVRQGDTFTFSLKVTEALPADPPAASGGLGWYLWFWGIDTDPDLSPRGWPFPQNQPGPQDFFVVLASDGDEYFAFVGDRRPLAFGGEEIITSVPFKVRGSSIQVLVDTDLLDNPAEFLWTVGSLTSHSDLGTEGHSLEDTNDPAFVPWPQN